VTRSVAATVGHGLQGQNCAGRGDKDGWLHVLKGMVAEFSAFAMAEPVGLSQCRNPRIRVKFRDCFALLKVKTEAKVSHGLSGLFLHRLVGVIAVVPKKKKRHRPRSSKNG